MRRPFYLLFVVLVCSCLSPRYSAILNPSADFTRFRTFYCSDCLETMDHTKPRYDNEETRGLIRDAIQQELEDRGYIFFEEHPDLLLEFDFIIEDHIDTTVQRTTSYRYWSGFETDTYNYKVGTLIINMIDMERGQVVWQGSAESLLEIEPDEVQGNISKVVNRIFRKYPFKIED